METWYKAEGGIVEPQKIEAHGSTEHFLILGERKRKIAKKSGGYAWHEFFKTRGEAMDKMIERTTEEITQSEERILSLREEIKDNKVFLLTMKNNK